MKNFVRAFLSACVASASVFAQSLQTVPPAFDTTPGTSGNSLPIANYTSGTLQVIYSADQMTGIPVGSVITGMQLRLNSSYPAFPPATFVASQYDVRFAGSSLTPGTMSGTYATNMVNPVLVRSGSLAVIANSYSGTGSPRPWGPVMPFTTGYVYNGGPLVIEWRVTSPSNTTAAYADLDTVSGTNSYMRTDNNSSATTATAGPVAGGPIVRLTFTPPPTDLAKGVTKVFVARDLATAAGNTGDGVLTWSTQFTQVAVASQDNFDTLGPGSDFVGLAWRQTTSASSAWPSAIANYGQFDVQLSRSTTSPGSLSQTIASNVGADAVTVRSGAMSLAIADFAPRGAAATAPFGAEIGFANAYHYKGGPLLSVVRHSGQTSGSIGSLDCLYVGGVGYGTEVQGWQMPSSSATVASNNSSYLVTKYSVDAGTSSPLNQLTPTPGMASHIQISPMLQTVISASELQYIPIGSVIDSMWMRQVGGALSAGPSTDITATDFEVALSSATAQPNLMSGTVATNEGADRVLVYDGGLVIPANSIPSGANGNFGKIVQFQKGFVYKGGPLCVTIQHTGLSATFDMLDAVQGTLATNRSIYSFAIGAPTGDFYGAGYSGSAIKLGYIPSVMTPNNLATTEGQNGWDIPFTAAYTVQTVIAASQLRAMEVGSLITGISLRNSSTGGSGSFPTSDTVLSQFDVSIAPAAHPPLSMSTTFASNVGPGEVIVRSGAMLVPANAYPASGSLVVPGQNAWYMPFTRAYRYMGGDLVVTMRGQGTLTGFGDFDGDGNVPSARGASIYNYSSSGATTGSPWGPLGMRLAFTVREFCRADLNNDGVVDDADFSLFIAGYNLLDCNDPGMAQGCPADLNYDRVVDDADFQIFVVAYNALVCP